MKKFILLALLVTPAVIASPFIISDGSRQVVTHCTLSMEGVTTGDIPVVTDAATGLKYCKFDMANTLSGSHIAKARFVNVDPLWGRDESIDSAPLPFVKPADTIPVVPDKLKLIP